MSMKERKIQASLIIHRVTRHSEAKAHSVQVQRERDTDVKAAIHSSIQRFLKKLQSRNHH